MKLTDITPLIVIAVNNGVNRVGVGVGFLGLRRPGIFYRLHRQDLPILDDPRHWRSEQYGQPVLCLG